MPAAVAIPGIIGAAGVGSSLLGGILGSGAASKAAKIQAAAAEQVANQASQTAQTAGQGALTAAGDAANTVNTATGQANDLLAGLYNARTSELSPYQTVGSTAANDLLAALQPGGSLNQNFTADQLLQNDPGYQFRLEQGQKGIGNATAAAGSTLGGSALKSLTRYNSDYASSEYDKAFNRFLENNQQKFNILSGTAGIGMRANDQALATTNSLAVPIANNGINAAVYQGNAGRDAAQYSGNALLQGLKISSDALTGGANARAAGVVGGANAWSGALSGAVNAGAGAYGLYQAGQRNNLLKGFFG